ncbi:hypothetical protein CGCF415_v000844 [Colletotrichum fructicola]|uniref:Uncharacterized protein n=1 Tax=Colletotrichum fructicola (strain Nara gc5) TaxID=1213859 RepID=A0A7J6JDT4_COLFN|nr:hypothetical protein CGGC5_v004156 [Colletotrichum fructicola Nara gc5]KAF4896331.1 hypothetical protein CGCFRS4_v005457 [Colletotrichum fructicola]KAF4916301.1 hypothetical protein CGCF415_v000844 [Colletotrichum fructicola]
MYVRCAFKSNTCQSFNDILNCSADDMDDATLQLVLQLQQADLKELRHEARGCNNKDGFLLDADLAFEMYQEELSFLETLLWTNN